MTAPQAPKLLDQVRRKIGANHYSIRTEDAYVGWLRRFILFCQKHHPRELGERDISAFPTHLAVHGKVSASTQNQALCALLFLYGEILPQDLDQFQNVVWARKPSRLPVVFTQIEVQAVLAHMDGTSRLMPSLLYGSGLRLMECIRLRVKDLAAVERTLAVFHEEGEVIRPALHALQRLVWIELSLDVSSTS